MKKTFCTEFTVPDIIKNWVRRYPGGKTYKPEKTVKLREALVLQ